MGASIRCNSVSSLELLDADTASRVSNYGDGEDKEVSTRPPPPSVVADDPLNKWSRDINPIAFGSHYGVQGRARQGGSTESVRELLSSVASNTH